MPLRSWIGIHPAGHPGVDRRRLEPDHPRHRARGLPGRRHRASQFGLGDIAPSFFFSPKQPTAGGWTLGVGPVFLLPSATDDLLGTEKWGAGPTFIALRQTDEGWTYGALLNHIWSFAGNEDRDDVSATFLQPFVAKQFSGARTLTANFESTYDWKHEQWVVPLNLTYSKVIKVGQQRMSLVGGVRGYRDGHH
jgi:hypothetical protein